MGAKWFTLAIEGDVQSKIEGILSPFRKELVGEINTTDSWEETASFLHSKSPAGSDAPMATCLSRGWTVFLEPNGYLSGDLWDEEEKCHEIANQLQSRLFISHAYGVTCSYGYRLFNGSQTRAVNVDENGIEDRGPKILGEPPVDEEDYNDESLIEVMELLGFDIDQSVAGAESFSLFRLQQQRFKSNSVTSKLQRKPWWQFW